MTQTEKHATNWKRHIIPVLHTLGRRSPILEAEIKSLSPQAQEELFRILQHADSKVSAAERKARDAQRGILRR